MVLKYLDPVLDYSKVILLGVVVAVIAPDIGLLPAFGLPHPGMTLIDRLLPQTQLLELCHLHRLLKLLELDLEPRRYLEQQVQQRHTKGELRVEVSIEIALAAEVHKEALRVGSDVKVSLLEGLHMQVVQISKHLPEKWRRVESAGVDDVAEVVFLLLVEV